MKKINSLSEIGKYNRFKIYINKNIGSIPRVSKILYYYNILINK
jgi:hypothetical protein